MAKRRHRLTLESFEERALPSVSFLPGGEFAESARAAKIDKVDSNESARTLVIPVVAIFSAQITARDGKVYDVDVVVKMLAVVTFNASSAKPDDSDGFRGGSGLGRVSNAPEPQFPSDSVTRSVSQSRANPAASILPVAPPLDSNAATPAAGSVSDATVAAQPQAAAEQGGLPVAAQILSGQFVSIATAGRILTGESIDVSDAPPEVIPPAETAEPPLAPPIVPEEPAVDSIIEVPNPFILPIAGALPIDIATLGACASNFLGRVTDLDVEWPEDMPGFEDYVWTAAAVLLTGGAIYSAKGSRTARTKGRLVAAGSALSDWEGKNVGRPY
jgi:hypothetical protein